MKTVRLSQVYIWAQVQWFTNFPPMY